MKLEWDKRQDERKRRIEEIKKELHDYPSRNRRPNASIKQELKRLKFESNLIEELVKFINIICKETQDRGNLLSIMGLVDYSIAEKIVENAKEAKDE